MKLKAVYLFMAVLFFLAACMVGCEADPGTPIYLTDSYEDGISLLEAENMRLTKPCSTAWRTKESIRLDREEYDALYCFAYDVIVSLYSHSYTTADEALLSDAYRRMTPTLAAAVKESQYFENHLRNIKENEIYALMKYLSIANGGYVDVVKNVTGQEAYMVWATFTLQTRGEGDNNNPFYSIEPWFVPGDTSFELWLYASAEEDGFQLLEFQESTVYMKKDTLFTAAGMDNVNAVQTVPEDKKDAVLSLIDKHSLDNGNATVIPDYESVKEMATTFVSTLYTVDYQTVSDTAFDSLYDFMSDTLKTELRESNYFETYLAEIRASSLSIEGLNQIKSETFDRGNVIAYKLHKEDVFLFHCFRDIQVSYQQEPDDAFFFRQGTNKLRVAFLIRKGDAEHEYEIVDWAYSLPLSEGATSD